MTQAMQILIRGRVQGVGYRAATHRKATSLGLTGWVRNREDGGVEAFVQGEGAVIEALVAWCHEGPPASVVESVRTSPGQLVPGLTAFEIRR